MRDTGGYKAILQEVLKTQIKTLVRGYLCLSAKPRHEKSGLWGFRLGPTQTGLYSHRKELEFGNFRYK